MLEWHDQSSHNIFWWIQTAHRNLSDSQCLARDTCWTMNRPPPCLECPPHVTPRTAPKIHHHHQQANRAMPNRYCFSGVCPSLCLLVCRPVCAKRMKKTSDHKSMQVGKNMYDNFWHLRRKQKGTRGHYLKFRKLGPIEILLRILSNNVLFWRRENKYIVIFIQFE